MYRQINKINISSARATRAEGVKKMKVKNEKWFNCALTASEAEIRIYGDIVTDDGWKWGDDDFCPSDLMDELALLSGRNLRIYVNSCGGNVFAGYAIYNALNRYKERYGAKITAEVDALAASIASVIIMAADKIIMPSNSYLMIHRPETHAEGNAAVLRTAADTLERIGEGVIAAYELNAAEGVDRERIVALMDAETWLSAKEAKELFATVELAEAVQIAARIKDSGAEAGKLPLEMRAAAENETRNEILKICIAGIVKGEKNDELEGNEGQVSGNCRRK